MAEIILASGRTHQEQMREILDLATELEHGHGRVNWAPRPGDLPYGGVVVVPDELAAAYFDRTAEGPDEVHEPDPSLDEVPAETGTEGAEPDPSLDGETDGAKPDPSLDEDPGDAETKTTRPAKKAAAKAAKE